MSPPVSSRPARALAAALLSVLLLVAGACADDDSVGVSELCDARNELEDALGDLTNVASGDEGIADAFDRIGEALEDLRDAAEDELDDEIDGVEQAVGRLDDAVTASEGRPLRERLSTFGDAVADVGASLDTLSDAAGAGC